MTSDVLAEKLAQQSSLLIVDVRNDWEYRAGHIPGAVNVPFWQVFRVKALLEKQDASLVLLYCEHGPRAWLAGLLLQLSGLRNIDYLAGHMSRWKRENRPLNRAG